MQNPWCRKIQNLRNECFLKASVSKGFTLVELLVVSCIISILLALLVPSLKAARDHAMSIVCANNLKQTGTALLNYSVEYDGLLPAVYDNYSKPWTYRLMSGGYLGSTPPSGWVNKSSPLVCPSYAPKVYTNEFACYGMALYDNWNVSINLPTVSNPVRYPIIGDSLGLSAGLPTTQGYAMYTYSMSAAATLLHIRHFNAANVFFADGHCSAMQANDIKSIGFNYITADGVQVP